MRILTTHQGVAFAKDGRLIDGQHRLKAIVLAGVAVRLLVIPNCDPDTFAVLDNGYKRQAAQLLRKPNAVVITAAARYLAVVASMKPPIGNIKGGVYASTLPTEDVLEIAEAWPELDLLSREVLNCRRNSSVNAPAHLAVLAQACRTRHDHLLDSWMAGVTYGAELKENDPRLRLRNRFAKERAHLDHNSGLAYNLIVKAWNAYVGGKEVTYLKVMDTEGVIAVVR